MTRFQKTSTSAIALGLCLSGSTAFADLSAREVWQDWQSYMSSFGYTMSGTENMSGDTLKVAGVTMAMELPEGAGNLTMTMSDFMFTENGDGTVTMTLPAVMPITVSVSAEGSENLNMTIDYATDNFTMVASGDTRALDYGYSADALSVELKELVVEGEPVDIGTAMMTMTNLSGTSAIKIGNLRSIAQTISTGAVSYDMNFRDPEGSGKMVLNGSLNGMQFQGQGDYPGDMNTSDMAAMMAAGLAFDGSFTHTGSALNMDFEDGADKVKVNTRSDSGKLGVAMSSRQLAYDAAAKNLNIMMAGAELPFPVELAMQDSGFKLQMPIGKSDEEQDFAFGLTLGDFTISDMIWGMVDPAGQLPRDPATIALDLSGKAKMFFNILDPEEMEAVDRGEVMPGELNALTLNSLTVRAAGAELTGSGAFTFDNSNMETFDGVPAPDGSVDLALTGGNGLLDKLVAMGLLPEEQAQGARMMMGLFAVPSGDDALTSKIEVKPDGQILANGQRIQ